MSNYQSYPKKAFLLRTLCHETTIWPIHFEKRRQDDCCWRCEISNGGQMIGKAYFDIFYK